MVNGFTGDNFTTRRKEIVAAINAPRLSQPIESKSQYFYFIRAVFTEKFTKVNGTIGFDLRGNGNNPPQAALYLGVKIDFSKFFGG